MRLLRATFLAALCVAAYGQTRIIRFDESIPFRMGEVTSRRIVHPGLGAKKTTLNFSTSQPGNEFAQHVHDYSDDTILVLQGDVNLRQGESYRLMKSGECAFVPTGQIHGTVTAGSGEAVMISFQNPPDLILYTGARDSKKPGAAAPKGVITPGAVKYVNFRNAQGEFTNSSMGSQRAAGVHRTLRPKQSFRARISPDGEGFVFVWKGSVRVSDGKNTWTAGERDTIFTQGAADLTITGTAEGTEVIQVSAPTGKAS